MNPKTDQAPLLVYCAASVEPALAPIAGAQKFADYLAASEKGGAMFKTLGYSALEL
jgi:hypothetical protein